MYINYHLYLLFSFHCVAKPPPLGGSQDGLPSEPQQPQPDDDYQYDNDDDLTYLLKMQSLRRLILKQLLVTKRIGISV